MSQEGKTASTPDDLQEKRKRLESRAGQNNQESQIQSDLLLVRLPSDISPDDVEEMGMQRLSSSFLSRAATWKEESTNGEGNSNTPEETNTSETIKPNHPEGHFSGAFLDMPTFWSKEVVPEPCTLLTLEDGFLSKEKDASSCKKKLRGRMVKWYEKAQEVLKTAGSEGDCSPLVYVPITNEDEDTARVILNDATRTFSDAVHCAKFSLFLHSMFHELGTYGQSMSYVAGVCMLALTEHETAVVLRMIAQNYIPGHWAAEAVGFATSAWLIESIMSEMYPKVSKSFDAMCFWPEMYMQKIISGLCVHVLQFGDLFQFLDCFVADGFDFLIRFVLSIVEHFEAKLLSLKPHQMHLLFGIMRLETSQAMCGVTFEDHKKILEKANACIIEGSILCGLVERRKLVFESKVAPRVGL